jgi:hypothetical protein
MIENFSRFTPESSALISIDHQVGTMRLIKNLPLDRVRRIRSRWPRQRTSWGCPSCSRPRRRIASKGR